MIFDADLGRNIPEGAKRDQKLMIAVLATQIQDYLYARGTTDDIEGEHLKSVRGKRWRRKRTPKEQRRVALLTRGLTAKAYIFDDTWESENYVFGFIFICSYIGLDPEKFRTAIRALKMEHISGVWDRARGK
jgi:hypothetical protein